MPKNKSINLLPQEEFDVSLLGRTLKWAMSTFRIIVIVTEMVVMGAFLSRFWLDAQNSDLTNAIKVKSAQIKALSTTEKDFRNLQSKINIAKQSKPNVASQRIEAITSKLPSGINLTSISITDTSAQIKGASTSEFGIAQFVANLNANSENKSVDLLQVTSSELDPSQTVFLISVSY